ncbi:MAG: AAA family ATPase [Erysipelothrix sp.]
MKVDLSKEELYSQDEIIFDKKINFIFGKNGTGKSKMTSLIKEQATDEDVYVFQGFQSVLGENGKLNSIILGEDNSRIEDEVKKKEEEIEKLKIKIIEIEKKITKPEDESVNLWRKLEKATENCKKSDRMLTIFLKDLAADIKNTTNPQISIPSYNSSNLKQEISKAFVLQNIEVNEFEEILKSEPKEAKIRTLFNVDLDKYLDATNEILQTVVEEKVIITRLDGDESKRKFAKDGLDLHKRGDVCAFCGNSINDEVFSEFESYFSADEVKWLQDRIQKAKEKLSIEKQKINSITINDKEFYSDFSEEVRSLSDRVDELKKSYISFFEELEIAIQNKEKNLFTKIDEITLNLPEKYIALQEEYVDLISRNNKSDLPKKQEIARNKLRFHFIKLALDNFEYDSKITQNKLLAGTQKQYLDEIEIEKSRITGKDGLDNKIEALNDAIKSLKMQTKNEELLAININDKLKHSVSFELVHQKVGIEQGYYQVKCLRTNDLRDATQLSTGEKNIISFLYFIEKLNEIREHSSAEKRIIIFDDPMSSNDDVLQYVIIDELQKLMKRCSESDKVIILTHNNHFYLNVKYSRRYNQDKFIRFMPNGKSTDFKIITNENDDFKTNYQALWDELKFLYNNELAKPEMLLNPIRRIIETFTKFNAINKNDFYKNQAGSKKLFDVNSHSIDDLEAELNGKEKTEILKIMKQCFVDNNSRDHFSNFWNIELD